MSRQAPAVERTPEQVYMSFIQNLQKTNVSWSALPKSVNIIVLSGQNAKPVTAQRVNEAAAKHKVYNHRDINGNLSWTDFSDADLAV